MWGFKEETDLSALTPAGQDQLKAWECKQWVQASCDYPKAEPWDPAQPWHWAVLRKEDTTKVMSEGPNIESESMLHAWNVKKMHMRFCFLDTPLLWGLEEVPCLCEKILKNTDISVISTMLCPCPATQYYVAIETEALCRFPSLPPTFSLKSFFFFLSCKAGLVTTNCLSLCLDVNIFCLQLWETTMYKSLAGQKWFCCKHFDYIFQLSSLYAE